MLLHLLRHQRLFRPRLTQVSAALLTCLAIGATLAWASVHIRLESSVPAAGEVVSTAPERFELRFSGPVNEALSSLVLVDPAGDSVNVTLGALLDDGRTLVGDVPELTGGEYLVLWKTVSADGHPVSGEFSFTYAGATAVADVPAMEAGDETDASPSEPGPPAGVVLLAGLGMACLLGFAGLLWYCGSSPLLREPRIGRATTLLGWAALLVLGVQYLAWTVSVLPAGAGSAGVAAASADGRWTLPAYPVEAPDAHGAGDVFVGALAACLAGASSLPEALRYANAAAALHVDTPEAQREQLGPEDVRRLLED